MEDDPKSEKFEKCPSGCGGTDIRVHFTEKDGKKMPEKYHLHWCTKCGIGYNIVKGFLMQCYSNHVLNK